MKYDKLFAMLTKAKQVLKYPKINFNVNAHNVQIYLATKGYIAIKINGEYCGKIMPETYQLKLYQHESLFNDIASFCQFPLESAKIFGQQYSHCCFCGLELTNKVSLKMGYGPICADNYGLPWEYTEVEDKLIDL